MLKYPSLSRAHLNSFSSIGNVSGLLSPPERRGTNKKTSILISQKEVYGAGNRIRTGDLLVGNEMLYH